ncbi:hypothetical protein [Amycolatopsis taiwanensis]|uniref:Uncharacterized protein n=1 Tax=Amycolatopsis taiwanensis TaxID=342230 RepID=A0A9W6R088_9PSEU|nr:hypothetical protein [Amycolatopsis taiwanensis]GLY65202.1 hypothetical protein Atai01_18210 [Amycolatopsis taiwanensis]
MSNDKPIAFPEGIPMLSRGHHVLPELGGCFMEIASVLAGEPWSDHPNCTHPMLAELARTVNDLVHDESRQQLVRWIPDVVGANRRHPLITAAIVAVLARHGLAAHPDDPDYRWAANRARHRAVGWQTGGRWRRAWLRATDLWFRTTDRVRVPVMVPRLRTAGDDVVIAALTDAIRAYHLTADRLAGGEDLLGRGVDDLRAAADR